MQIIDIEGKNTEIILKNVSISSFYEKCSVIGTWLVLFLFLCTVLFTEKDKYIQTF